MPDPINITESEDEIELICSSSDHDEVEFVSHIKRSFDMTSDDSRFVDLTKGDKTSIYRDRYAVGSFSVENALTSRIPRDIRPPVTASSSTRPLKQRNTVYSRQSFSPQKRKRLPSTEPIEISDDDEPVEHSPNDYDRLNTQKRPRLHSYSPIPASNDISPVGHDNLVGRAREDSEEDEYDGRFHVNDHKIWRQDPINTVIEKMNTIHVTHSPPTRSRRPLHMHTNLIPSKGKGKEVFIWDELQFESRLPPIRSSESFDRKPKKVNRRQNSIVKEFRKSAGSINQVVQHHGRIVVCSSASGGGQDEEEEEQNPYNKQAALVLWDDVLNSHVLEGHWAIKRSENAREHRKFYTVNGVAFDPHSSAFASSATDKRVIVWSPSEEQDCPEDMICRCFKPYTTHKYSAVPHDLAFMPHPDDSILAVAAQNITVHRRLHSRSGHLSLDVVPQEGAKLHSAGAFSWGTGPTSRHLFASSEPNNDDPDNILENGFHKAFDIEKTPKCELFAFDATEGGDALTLSPSGGLVALFTRTESQNFLRLYDVERKVGKAQEKIVLQPHSGLEVNRAAFSPDGLYLAVARSDNHTHIYDARMLGAGILHDFEHDGPARTSPGHGAYGVVHAEWTESSTGRLGLVTGGQDGFVRLWHPLRAHDEENGRVLGKANADVGHFSLGDRYKGEHELVIGDGDGGLYIFDGLGDF